MAAPRDRTPSEVLRRGYSDDEVAHIYELGRFYLENGSVRPAEAILIGLTEVVPEFAPAWLGMAYIHILNREYEAAIHDSKQALKADPNFVEAVLFLISCLLTTKDLNTAGTYLGEIGEKIDAGAIDNPHVIRFYRAQLARYQNRS